LQEARRVFIALGDPEPCLRAFDAAVQKPLPFEAKLRTYLEKKSGESAEMRAN
jgi:hypothetical protein